MKLCEIKIIPSNPTAVFKLPDSVILAAKVVGKSDHREIFSATFEDKITHYVFFNKDTEGNVTSYVVVNERRIFDRDVAEIVRTWTRSDLQNKGYVSAILKFIRDFSKMSIMSDDEQTPQSREFWKNLSRKFNVQMIDIETGDISDVDETILYSKSRPEKYRLFIESYEFIAGVGKIPNSQKSLNEWSDSILLPYVYFEDGDI